MKTGWIFQTSVSIFTIPLIVAIESGNRTAETRDGRQRRRVKPEKFKVRKHVAESSFTSYCQDLRQTKRQTNQHLSLLELRKLVADLKWLLKNQFESTKNKMTKNCTWNSFEGEFQILLKRLVRRSESRDLQLELFDFRLWLVIFALCNCQIFASFLQRFFRFSRRVLKILRFSLLISVDFLPFRGLFPINLGFVDFRIFPCCLLISQFASRAVSSLIFRILVSSRLLALSLPLSKRAICRRNSLRIARLTVSNCGDALREDIFPILALRILYLLRQAPIATCCNCRSRICTFASFLRGLLLAPRFCCKARF